MKSVLILGSTGSIGKSTLSVLRAFPGKFAVAGLSAAKSITLLAEQVKEFKPKAVHIADADAYTAFMKHYRFRGLRVYSGDDGLVRLVRETKCALVLNALVGSAGFQPTVAAIEKGVDVALANKETLVMGGDIIMPLAKKNGVNIIPVDSEHSAIFQILRHFKGVGIHKLILTASGGPFRTLPKNKFSRITVARALKHPTWSMGSKISIDSATMMNKGLEVIEAHHLFGIPYDRIEVVVHPQSIIHSLVEFVDGEMYAQMGPTDMRYPIQNALTYPDIKPTPFHRLDITKIGELQFFPPDLKKFRMLALAYRFGEQGGSAPAVFNAANEIAVAAFLGERIRFTDIPRVAAAVTGRFPRRRLTPENIIGVDRDARSMAAKEVERCAKQ
ncbi:MAG: 1-deoxy-D-xylulose-5-phosphate reductoisomerase [Spirochaetes bacterium]|nr:1-deoxy-D-xylulose-5-phosphate reductoisomerase [Spirochaetota bacterium]